VHNEEVITRWVPQEAVMGVMDIVEIITGNPQIFKEMTIFPVSGIVTFQPLH
jgi:hypothetical protein